MSDIDKRLDSVLDNFSITDKFNKEHIELFKQTIKQLMADEFEKMIGEDIKTEIQLGDVLFTDRIGYVKVEDVNELNILKQNQLRKELRQKLEEWKK